MKILSNSRIEYDPVSLIVDGKRVKIDADDFIRLRGADAFEQLLSGSGGGSGPVPDHSDDGVFQLDQERERIQQVSERPDPYAGCG